MSDLSHIEKRDLERLFGMKSGYVLDFSDQTLGEFVLDSTDKNIYDPKYDYSSGSKANRLRAFWKVEPNYVVAPLLRDLLEHASHLGVKAGEEQLHEMCRRTVERLSQNSPVPEIEVITASTTEKGFAALAKSVREAIQRNEPESGLDHLHTFVVKYLREICGRHSIATEKHKPIHSLVGEYVKYLRKKGLTESDMTERILKSSISTLEAFSHVRNDQSLAHDNSILNYDESLLIFNHVVNTIKFIQAIECGITDDGKRKNTRIEEVDELPF